MEKSAKEGKRWRTVTNLILHLHPARVPAQSIRFTLTFGLGGMAALLIALQFFTGIMLRFQYTPEVSLAYQSIVSLQQDHLFGQLIRNIHHWSGQFLVVIAFLHLARVIFTTAYFPPRRSNWLLGLGLFIGILLMNFTGYLLPWDQLSYWAVTVASSMLDYVPLLGRIVKEQVLGGNEVGQATLLNFYNFHTGVLPLFLLILMAYHFWKVRKAGGVILPSSSDMEEESVPVIPDLVLKELTTSLVLLAFVLLFSLLVNAPLMEKANPAISPNPAKAPWYFLGIQELIMHIHPFFSVFFVPVTLLVLIILVPYSKRNAVNTGRWFSSGSTKKILFNTLVVTLILVPAWILADQYFFSFREWMPSLPVWVSEGIIPMVIFSALVFVLGWIILKKYRLPYNELIMCGFVFIGMSYIILMLTTLCFRGPGMELLFPF